MGVARAPSTWRRAAETSSNIGPTCLADRLGVDDRAATDEAHGGEGLDDVVG